MKERNFKNHRKYKNILFRLLSNDFEKLNKYDNFNYKTRFIFMELSSVIFKDGKYYVNIYNYKTKKDMMLPLKGNVYFSISDPMDNYNRNVYFQYKEDMKLFFKNTIRNHTKLKNLIISIYSNQENRKFKRIIVLSNTNRYVCKVNKPMKRYNIFKIFKTISNYKLNYYVTFKITNQCLFIRMNYDRKKVKLK